MARHGLKAMNRHHVHLSAPTSAALSVSLRRGWPVPYALDAGATVVPVRFDFYRLKSGVWLTDAVPTEYLSELPRP